ncbi:MAG: SMP-30/gluconolactonase/LRE family protein [Pseudomonadota bacterium]
MPRTLLALTLAGFALAIAVWGLLTVRSFNHFDQVTSRFDGQCKSVAGIAGPEDIQIDFRTGFAFVSSFDRRGALAKGAKTTDLRGAVHRFDLANPLDDRSWRDLTGGVPARFQPLGLHLYRDENGARLFVVNAAQKSVELYDVHTDGTLTHLEQFTERRLSSPNDVVAVGPRAFYVTNDNNATRGTVKSNINFLFRRGTGKVLYFNGISWHEAATNIQYANGLAVNRAGDRLYVGETAGESLIDYRRDPQTGYLKLHRRIGVNAAVDNINIDEEGQLWIGAHPRPLALLRHQRDQSALAPSSVFRFDEATDSLSEIYADDGSVLSGSSSAARLGSSLVIGALFEEKFLICRMAAGL